MRWALVIIGLSTACTDLPIFARDLDCDGTLRPSELWALDDYGSRTDRDGPSVPCLVVFEYKDGRPLTRWCGRPPRCERLW